MGKIVSEIRYYVGSLTTNSHTYAQYPVSKSRSPIWKNSEYFEIKESQWELDSENPAFSKQVRVERAKTAHLKGVVNTFCGVVPQFYP